MTETSRTEEAARQIAAGKEPWQVIDGRMPALDHGDHPARRIVAGYRREAMEAFVAVRNVALLWTPLDMLDDQVLHAVMLQCEEAALRMHRYFETRAAAEAGA